MEIDTVTLTLKTSGSAGVLAKRLRDFLQGQEPAIAGSYTVRARFEKSGQPVLMTIEHDGATQSTETRFDLDPDPEPADKTDPAA